MEFGADVVVYSATKHIDGQGRCLGGVVLGSETFVKDHLHTYLKHTGPSLSPFNAWTMLKGLETLPLRVRQQSENAAWIADRLAAHAAVSRVIYCGRGDHPQAGLAAKQMRGGGQIVSFEIAGGKAGAFRFLNALRLIKLSNNLWRFQIPDHAPGDDDAPAIEARTANRPWPNRRVGASLRWIGGSPRSHRGYRSRLGQRRDNTRKRCVRMRNYLRRWTIPPSHRRHRIARRLEGGAAACFELFAYPLRVRALLSG